MGPFLAVAPLSLADEQLYVSILHVLQAWLERISFLLAHTSCGMVNYRAYLYAVARRVVRVLVAWTRQHILPLLYARLAHDAAQRRENRLDQDWQVLLIDLVCADVGRDDVGRHFNQFLAIIHRGVAPLWCDGRGLYTHQRRSKANHSKTEFF